MGAQQLSPTWQALHAIVERLMDKRQELAMVQTAKHADWYATFAASEDRTVSGREREADLATVALANEVTKLRADIAADEELRDFLTLAITSGVEVV